MFLHTCPREFICEDMYTLIFVDRYDPIGKFTKLYLLKITKFIVF